MAIKYSSLFHLQLKKSFTPPSAHLKKCHAPSPPSPGNAKIGYANSIAWSLSFVLYPNQKVFDPDTVLLIGSALKFLQAYFNRLGVQMALQVRREGFKKEGGEF